MKFYKVIIVLFIATLISCGGKDTKKKAPDYSSKSKSTVVKKEAEKKKTPKKEAKKEMVDLSNKGIGPIKSVDISKPIDQKMAANGKELFKNKCSSCHRVNRKFIGPNPTGIFERRSPEWVMNMIMNPEEMVKKDPIAKQLLIDFNGSPMANQNMNKEETRAIVEYFRTLK